MGFSAVLSSIRSRRAQSSGERRSSTRSAKSGSVRDPFRTMPSRFSIPTPSASTTASKSCRVGIPSAASLPRCIHDDSVCSSTPAHRAATLRVRPVRSGSQIASISSGVMVLGRPPRNFADVFFGISGGTEFCSLCSAGFGCRRFLSAARLQSRQYAARPSAKDLFEGNSAVDFEVSHRGQYFFSSTATWCHAQITRWAKASEFRKFCKTPRESAPSGQGTPRGWV